MIVGGGTMPPEIVERFLTLAGGRKAKIVVLPTGVPRSETSREVPRFLNADRVESIVVLEQRGAEVATEEFRTAIQGATGVWFGGGRQWNFVDAYEETPAVELFRDVLRRGGVIGGSSAGATIQGEFLVRGHPMGNTVMMAEGYERGFGFLPGVAIDQHFTQRSRQRDLLTVIQRHPKLLGIGIDEGTAIVVTGSVAEVIGLHAVHFVSARNLNALSAGQSVPSNCEEAAKFYKSIVSGESLDLTTLQ
jgi:cyanophycinase